MHLAGLDVLVIDVDHGNPRRMLFRFDRALDDPHLIFLQARPDGLRRLALPPIDGSVRLPRAAAPWESTGN